MRGNAFGVERCPTVRCGGNAARPNPRPRVAPPGEPRADSREQNRHIYFPRANRYVFGPQSLASLPDTPGGPRSRQTARLTAEPQHRGRSIFACSQAFRTTPGSELDSRSCVAPGVEPPRVGGVRRPSGRRILMSSRHLLCAALLTLGTGSVQALEPGHFAGPPGRNCWRIVGFGHGPGYHAYGCCSPGCGASGCATLPCGVPGCGAYGCATGGCGPGWAASPAQGALGHAAWGCPQAQAGWVAASGPFPGDQSPTAQLGHIWGPPVGAGSFAVLPPAPRPTASAIVPTTPPTHTWGPPLVGQGRMAAPLRVR